MKTLLLALVSFQIMMLSAIAGDRIFIPEKIQLSSGEVQILNTEFEFFVKENRSVIDRARRGDVVGNGGGVIEGQTAFFYNSLEKILAGTIEENRLVYDQKEIEVLEKIIANLNDFKASDKLIFIDNQDFFLDNENDEIRSARTGFSRMYPIYFNRSLLYDRIHGDYSPLVALLVHELGHQAGIASHSFLDSLGSKVQYNLNARADMISTNFNSHKMEVVLFNYSNVGSWSDIVVRFQDKVNSLPKIDYNTMKMKCNANQPVGYEMENVHWAMRPMFTQTYFVAFVNAWVNFRCVDNDGQIFSSFGTARLRIKISLQGITFETEVR